MFDFNKYRKAARGAREIVGFFGNIVAVIAGALFIGAGVFIATRDASEMTVEGIEGADPKAVLLIFGSIFAIIGLVAAVSAIAGIVKTLKGGVRGIIEEPPEYKEVTVFESTDENAVPNAEQLAEPDPSERRNMSSAYYFFHADNGTDELYGGVMFTVIGSGMAAIIVISLSQSEEPISALIALFPLIFAVLGVRMIVKEVKSRLKYVREMKERDRYTH